MCAGSDFAGVLVVPRNTADTSLYAGQAVFGVTDGALATHVLAPSSRLHPIPAGTSCEEAATLPTVFVTVNEAFTHACEVRARQRCATPSLCRC